MADDSSAPDRGIAEARTDAAEFAAAFRADPAGALRVKGIVLSDEEATRLGDEVRRMQQSPQGTRERDWEIKIVVSIPF